MTNDLHRQYNQTVHQLREIRAELRERGAEESSNPPYTAIYTPVLTALLDDMRHIELFVLLALVGHCDHYGICYPGIRRLASMTHLSPDNVRRGLASLIQWGYIIMLEIQNPLLDQKDPYYIVSQRVIHIRPELRQEAQKRWDAAQKATGMSQHALAFVVQPAPNQNQTSTSNQHQTSYSNQPTPSDRGEGLGAQSPTGSGAPLDNATSGKDTNHPTPATQSPSAERTAQNPPFDHTSLPTMSNADPRNPSPTGQQAEGPSPRSAAPPSQDPPLPPDFDADAPLPIDAEQAVIMLRTLSGFTDLSLTNGRTLVARYGQDLVFKQALSISNDRGVNKPTAVLISRLRKHYRKHGLQSEQTLADDTASPFRRVDHAGGDD